MQAQATGDPDDDRVLDVDRVFRGPVPDRASRRPERAEGDGQDVVGHDVLEEFGLLEVGVHLHLVGRRLDAGIAQQQAQLGDGHVGGADVANEALSHCSLELPPRREVAFVTVGLRSRIARADIDAGCVMVGERPVDQVQVQVLETQVVEGLPQRGEDILGRVPVIPELGRDPEVLARHAAGLDPLERCSDLRFVPVHGCAVEVAVAHGCGAQHGLCDRGSGDVVGPEGPEADGGHRRTGPQATRGYQPRVDTGDRLARG